ncbi:hypothetical protein Tco_1130522 [Tanacetum coccineum]
MLQPSFLLSSQPQQLKCNLLLLNIHKKAPLNLRGENIKKYKGKKAMSLKDAEEVSTESDFDDETTYVLSSMVESSKKKELKKFNFEEAKDKAAKREGEMRKEELIDLLGLEVVNKYIKKMIQVKSFLSSKPVTYILNREKLLKPALTKKITKGQLAKERRARLELAEVVDSMRRGQEPRGDV